MTDAALRSRLGAAAKERVEREFRWDRVAERVASRLGG
jgi:glycosyltransferase involved in cell wall biosynthesis